MILIIGGAWQGKLSWAVREYGLAENELCNLSHGFEPGKRCYYHLEALTFANQPIPVFPDDAIVIAREAGSGVVPMEKEQRFFRECHGAALQMLSRQAEHVIRIFCGLAEVLK